MQLGTHDLVINKLRLQGSGQPLLARQRVEAALGLMELQQAHASRDAIMVVRKLRVPGPAALWEQSFDMVTLRDWQARLQEQMALISRNAARPAAGPVPANADAVIFADRAEWLACLLRDALTGRLSDAWWFASAAQRYLPAQLAVHSLAEHVQVVPVAFQHLARFGVLRRVAEAVGEVASVWLFRRLAECHGLQGLFEQVAERLERGQRRREESHAQQWSEPHPFAAQSTELTVGSAWLRVWVGVALTLAREPRRARTRSFAAAVVASLANHSTHPVVRVDGPVHARADQAAEPVAAGAHTPRSVVDAVRKTQEIALESIVPGVQAVPSVAAESAQPVAARELDASPPSAAAVEPAFVASPTQVVRVSPSERVANARTPAAAAFPEPVRPAAAATEPGRPETLLPARERSAGAPVVDAEERGTLSIETELGGVFFLVQVAIRLGLYGDMFTPREPGIDLPLCDFLALLARELLGDACAPEDPLWRLLQQTSGRRADEPWGGEFLPPSAWVIPPSWLGAFAHEGPYEVQLRVGRVIVMHEAGFCALDAPATSSAPDVQLTAALGIATARVRPAQRAVMLPEDGLPRWVAWVASYVRARLALALGVERDAVADLVLRRRARVTVTALRVDVSMPLAQHPIELRRAGLDRDVGFVPALSRTISFHFASAENDKET